jgi:replication fork clamp-binding protein CrfC
MSDAWKDRLKTVSLWLLFLGGVSGWAANGCQGPPPMPPLLQQVADQQAETLARVKALEATPPVVAGPLSRLDGNSTDDEVKAALLADLDRLLSQRSWIVGDEQKRLLRAVREVVETDAQFIQSVRAKLGR